MSVAGTAEAVAAARRPQSWGSTVATKMRWRRRGGSRRCHPVLKYVEFRCYTTQYAPSSVKKSPGIRYRRQVLPHRKHDTHTQVTFRLQISTRSSTLEYSITLTKFGFQSRFSACFRQRYSFEISYKLYCFFTRFRFHCIVYRI